MWTPITIFQCSPETSVDFKVCMQLYNDFQAINGMVLIMRFRDNGAAVRQTGGK
jgi:hypothetical protein